MTTSTPPGEPRFVKGAVTGTYLVYVTWAKLPLGTVVKIGRGGRWEAFTRLGRPVGSRPSRERAAAALAAWTWSRTPAPARRHALKVMREEARLAA